MDIFRYERLLLVDKMFNKSWPLKAKGASESKIINKKFLRAAAGNEVQLSHSFQEGHSMHFWEG